MCQRDVFLQLLQYSTLSRPVWAEIRDTYFSDGVNRKSLELIEKSAFFMTLDEEPKTLWVSLTACY